MTLQPSPIRVLIVDDDDVSLELLSVLLEAEGYAVQSADSGESALALLRESTSALDLVLADVQMPGTTGAQLAGELRRICGPETRLLAMSGSQPAPEAIAPFDGFLLKPFKMREVASALKPRGPIRTPIKTKRERSLVVSGMAAALQSRAKPTATRTFAAQKASNKNMNTSARQPQSSEAAGNARSNLVLNEKIYQQLAGSMPPQQLLEMYAMCLNDARERIAGMRVLVGEHDQTKFRREAHSIKGGCGMLGATELHSMAAALESGGLESSPAEDEKDVNSLDELSAACDRLERMLRSRV